MYQIIAMMAKYYRLGNELDLPEDRWFLKSLNVVDDNKMSVWEFVTAAKVKLPEDERLKIGFREHGTPLDFTFADFSVLVVNEKVAFLLDEAECQLIPVEIEGLNNKHKYFVAILFTAIDCLDENKSDFEKFIINDPIRPDKAGEYKAIYQLFVDPTKIQGNNIFRLQKSNSRIIVSEELKRRFEKSGVTGVKFTAVT